MVPSSLGLRERRRRGTEKRRIEVSSPSFVSSFVPLFSFLLARLVSTLHLSFASSSSSSACSLAVEFLFSRARDSRVTHRSHPEKRAHATLEPASRFLACRLHLPCARLPVHRVSPKCGSPSMPAAPGRICLVRFHRVLPVVDLCHPDL